MPFEKWRIVDKKSNFRHQKKWVKIDVMNAAANAFLQVQSEFVFIHKLQASKLVCSVGFINSFVETTSMNV